MDRLLRCFKIGLREGGPQEDLPQDMCVDMCVRALEGLGFCDEWHILLLSSE